jgi:voltage-dependent potassium channel beta subunit
MEYRYLGKSGLKVSAISYGSYVTFNGQFGEDVAYDCMVAAYEAGVNFFDNAEAYADGKAELMMGKVLKKTGWKRSDLVLSTKIFWGGKGVNDRGLSRKHIIEGTDASLQRLGTDYVDLIFCHRPDLYTPIEETVRAMNHVINQGKAFYWGTSEWSKAQIMEAYQIARREHLIPPLMEQPEYSMLKRDKLEQEYLTLFEDIGLGTTIWGALKSGFLTGKYNNGIPDGSRLSLDGFDWLKDILFSEEGKRNMEKIKQLTKIADELEISMAALALAWVLKNPIVSTAMVGGSSVEQVKENMKVIDYVSLLTDDVMERIEVILDNKPLPERDWKGV